MAEIKSTIDLVMERTKHMLMSDEEREQIRIDEMEKKAKGLVLSLRESRIDQAELARTIDDIPSEDLTDFLVVLFKTMVDSLGLTAEPDLNSGLRLIAPPEIEPLLDRLESAQGEFSRLENEHTGQGHDQALEELAQKGITGSALRPKVDQAQVQSLENERQAAFENIKAVKAEMISAAG